MASQAFASVDEYLASMSDEHRAVLEEVRQAMRAGLPGSEECISYSVPAYRVQGVAVVYFAGWKGHYAVYPASEAMLAAFSGRLAPFKPVNSTLKAPYDQPVPIELIGELAQFRAAEVARIRAAKKATKVG